ncbi:MAG: MFS transporter [Gammaproteobacteria bacterium]|nr:MFS transporter [Gammaproteobacteria bacterium]
MREQRNASPFSNRAFRLLFGGSSVSIIGDQFTLVALPWLVLKLTGDPAALGLVLAVMALPRAAFMLVSGAMVDRMSPRRVLLSARLLNAALTAVLAALVLAGAIHMWMLYLLALGIGLATAFAYPAGSAILPQLLEPGQLQTANSIFMGMRQLSMLIGPALAGFVISAGAGVTPESGGDIRGTGLAFAIDAGSFLFSVTSLLMIRIRSDRQPSPPAGGILGNIVDGLRALWADLPLRALILYMAAVSVFVAGPLQVGLPLLADTRLEQGATALGLLMTANGTGMLLGSLASGLIARLVRGRLGLLVLGLDGVAGLGLASLGFVHSTLTATTVLVLIGTFAGSVQITIITWLQRRVPQALLGRTMSLVMFTFLGLAPVAAAVAGALVKLISLTALFTGAGLSLTAIALFCLSQPSLRGISLQSASAA